MSDQLQIQISGGQDSQRGDVSYAMIEWLRRQGYEHVELVLPPKRGKPKIPASADAVVIMQPRKT